MGLLSPGSVGVLTLRATVAAPDPLTVNASVVGADQFDPDSSQDAASAKFTPQQADMAAGLTVDSPRPNVGDVVTFTVTITNGGPDASSGVDLLSPGLTFAGSDSDQGTYSPSSGVWAPGTIAPGASLALRVRARVDSPEAHTNLAAM